MRCEDGVERGRPRDELDQLARRSSWTSVRSPARSRERQRLLDARSGLHPAACVPVMGRDDPPIRRRGTRIINALTITPASSSSVGTPRMPARDRPWLRDARWPRPSPSPPDRPHPSLGPGADLLVQRRGLGQRARPNRARARRQAQLVGRGGGRAAECDRAAEEGHGRAGIAALLRPGARPRRVVGGARGEPLHLRTRFAKLDAVRCAPAPGDSRRSPRPRPGGRRRCASSQSANRSWSAARSALGSAS